MEQPNYSNYVAPDMTAYEQELERIQRAKEARDARKGSRKFDGKLFFYKWKPENNLLFLPPWDPTKKMVFKRVVKFRKLPPDSENHMCIEKTYPELKVVCPLLGVLNEAEARGHKVKRLKPSTVNYWQILDLDGIVEEITITDKDGNVKKVNVDFRMTPQVISLPPSAHDELFMYIYNPDVGYFYDPYTAVPMEIIRKIGQNDIPTYSVKPITNFVNGKKQLIRMPIADTVEQIEAIVGKIEGDHLVGGLLYNLDTVFQAPLKELEGPNGKIYQCAQKLYGYFRLNIPQDQQGMPAVPVSSGTMTPGIPLQAGVYIPPAMQSVPPPPTPPTPPTPPVPPPTPPVPPPTPPVPPPTPPTPPVLPPTPPVPPPTPPAETQHTPGKPRDMNIPEDQLLNGGKAKKILFPGAPNCFGKYLEYAESKSKMQNDVYVNGVMVLDESMQTSACTLCPYKAVCQATPQQ